LKYKSFILNNAGSSGGCGTTGGPDLTIGNGGFEDFKSWSAFEGGCEGCEIKDLEDCGDGDF
jgi:hypothetical protein